MIIDRVILKQRAKDAFRRNYGASVLVAFIFLIFCGSNVVQIRTSLEEAGIHIPPVFISMAGLVMLVLSIFVFKVLEVGIYRFFVENRDYSAPTSKMLFGFNCGHYSNIVGTMFLMNLKISLWTMLFIIPGIIKTYEYKMVPYILAEQPDISQKEAFSISRDMMMGYKSDAFILDLSFIGWEILSVFTCGIVGIFWTQPYVLATQAELYTTLRDEWMGRYNQAGPNMTGENF